MGDCPEAAVLLLAEGLLLTDDEDNGDENMAALQGAPHLTVAKDPVKVEEHKEVEQLRSKLRFADERRWRELLRERVAALDFQMATQTMPLWQEKMLLAERRQYEAEIAEEEEAARGRPGNVLARYNEANA